MRFKKIMAAFMSATLALGVLGGSLAMREPATVKAASFTDYDQDEIVAQMGAGWNLGNQLEACISGVPYETAWGNPTITESLIKAVKAAGFSTIRVPVSYLSKIGSDYTIDSSWLNRVQEVVDMCINNDLYVIINMHGDGYNSVDGGWLLCNASDQTTIRAKYEACWKQIATKFKDYDEHLIFESMNEEFDGTYGTPNSTYYSNINTLNQIFVDTVRQTGGNNAMRWLLVPGWNTNIEYTAGNYGFVIPSDNYLSSSVPSGEKRIMISVHYYDPWGFCGEESSTTTQWGSSATDSSKVASYGDESYLNSQFYNLYSAFTSKGYPVIIGEYGAIDKSAYDSTNTACRVEWTKKVCTYAKQYGCVPVWWDNGYTGTYGFGLFDRNTYAVTQQSIIDAIIGVMGTGGSSSSGSSSSGSSSTTTTIELNANNLTKGTYTSDYTYGNFTIGASSSKYISVESTSATINGTSYTQRLKMNGAANSTGRYIKFTTDGAATVDIIGISTSTSATRVIRLAKDSVGGTTIGDITVSGTAGVQTINVSSAGTYYLYSTNSGIYIYDVKVTSTSSSSSSDSSTSTSGTLDGTYYIKSYYSGKYLDVADGSSANSANIQQYSYSGTDGQKFKLVSAGDGYYYIYTGASSYSKVIDVAGKSTADGANVLQYAYNGNSNQKFKVTEVSDGVYAILTGVTSGASCLDVYGWSTADGGNIAQWTYWGGACQLWYLEAAN